MIKAIVKHIVLFLVGGLIYCILEILFRGNSHWTMYILGGMCFILLGCMNEHCSWDIPLWIQSVAGSIIITILEFWTGCIVNLWLGWNVWDYSQLPLNILGQICLPFSILWCMLSVVGIVLDDYLRYWWFHEEKPNYKLF